MHLAIILSMQLYTTMIIKWPSCSQKWGINWSTACDPIVSMMEQLSHDEMIAYLIFLKSLKSFLGEDKLKEFINFTLHYIAGLDISIKRGTFIELRSGMLNVSPIGQNCSQEEHDEFEKYDKACSCFGFPMRLGQDLQFKIPWGGMTMKFMNQNELLVIQ
ncbi:phosphomannomutase [Musa troglodytarum]|uniref:Phosphomannomutase n=1 Tax=Musa troglodytarum TaxID=320322 RepID=A0A9E7I6N4_9LILI|nr:phosphomannomutase [Musa troglodytarum]